MQLLKTVKQLLETYLQLLEKREKEEKKATFGNYIFIITINILDFV